MASQEFPTTQQPDQDQNNDQRVLSGFKVEIPEYDSELDLEISKNQILEETVPDQSQRVLYKRFHNLKQGSRPVEDYAKEFLDMKVRIDNIHDSEEQLAIRFISGLHPRLQNIVNQSDPTTVHEARCQASFVEKQIQEETSWLRNNIFQSKCMIEGETIDFVIDSGSCANLISEETVRKLALRIESHPNPYCLGWLDQRNKIQISKQVLVKLDIESMYQDQIYCDVVQMDVSHLILGRPWQFDRRVLHNGFTNTYIFNFQGRKITLFPN